LNELDISKLLISTDDQGVYLRTELFQSVQDALSLGYSALLDDEVPAFGVQSPGLIARRELEQSSYLDKFPQFVARVTPELQASDAGQDSLMTLPSACLCLYPVVSGRWPIPTDGLMATVKATCFRNEAGYGPERMRSFTMSEYVFFGRPDQTGPFRDKLVARVSEWVAALGLTGRVDNANDPFFGRLGELLAEKQRRDQLKLELFLPISSTAEIACFSFNEHREFFGSRWDITTPDGAVAHSACVGVGLERLTLAVFHHHGLDIERWPSGIREQLQV
jgi:seryl-tRNA synthetase